MVACVIFCLDELQLALPLESVESVLRAVASSGLPDAPPIVSGVVNIHGRIVPVVDLRKRLGLPARELRSSDRMVLAHTGRRAVVVVVDSVRDVCQLDEADIVPADRIVPGLKHIAGAVGLDGGIVLIDDLDRFLSLDEEQALDRAMAC